MREKLRVEEMENQNDNKSSKNNADVNKLLFPPMSQVGAKGKPRGAPPQPNYLPGDKLENTFGEMGRVICPRGFHYKAQGTFGHAACKFNSEGCKKYDKVAGNCRVCELFYEMATDPFNKNKYCTLGTFWTILVYSAVIFGVVLGFCR